MKWRKEYMFVFRQKWKLGLNLLNHQDIFHIGLEQKYDCILSRRPKVIKQNPLYSVLHAGDCYVIAPYKFTPPVPHLLLPLRMFLLGCHVVILHSTKILPQ
jgi:hypothetical protein